MIAVLGHLLPLMLAVALSSVPIMVVVTILLTPASRSSALTFLIGWLIGIFGVAALLTLGLMAVPRTWVFRNQALIGIVEIVVGCGVLAWAVILFVRTRASHPQSQLPRWLRMVGTIRPLTAFGLALLLNLRPKALLLATAAALVLGGSRLSPGETVIALLIFTVVGGSTIGVPVVYTLARPRAARRPLEAAERWIVRNSATVTLVMLLVIGTVVIGNGMTRL